MSIFYFLQNQHKIFPEKYKNELLGKHFENSHLKLYFFCICFIMHLYKAISYVHRQPFSNSFNTVKLVLRYFYLCIEVICSLFWLQCKFCCWHQNYCGEGDLPATNTVNSTNTVLIFHLFFYSHIAQAP